MLPVGSLSESIAVDGLVPGGGGGGRGAGRGVAGGVAGGAMNRAAPAPPAAPSAAEAYQVMQEGQAAAQGATLGELFEYKIKEPITLEKNKSALVPIVHAQVAAERVSLWNRSTGSGRPLRAMWLTKSVAGKERLSLTKWSPCAVPGSPCRARSARAARPRPRP